MQNNDLSYAQTFRSVRMSRQTVSTTGTWERIDYLYAAVAVGLVVLIGVGGSIAASLGLV